MQSLTLPPIITVLGTKALAGSFFIPVDKTRESLKTLWKPNCQGPGGLGFEQVAVAPLGARLPSLYLHPRQ